MPDQEFPEKFSAKHKRGRPQSEILNFLGSLFPDLQTRRSLNNIKSQTRALQVLKRDAPDVMPFFCTDAKIRKTALYALGRIQNDGDLVEIARFVQKEEFTSAGIVSFCQEACSDETLQRAEVECVR